MWDSRLTIEHFLFMWKLLNGFLGIDDIRKRMGFHLASQCGCKNGDDSLNNIFLHCTHANYIWRECSSARYAIFLLILICLDL